MILQNCLIAFLLAVAGWSQAHGLKYYLKQDSIIIDQGKETHAAIAYTGSRIIACSQLLFVSGYLPTPKKTQVNCLSNVKRSTQIKLHCLSHYRKTLTELLVVMNQSKRRTETISRSDRICPRQEKTDAIHTKSRLWNSVPFQDQLQVLYYGSIVT